MVRNRIDGGFVTRRDLGFDYIMMDFSLTMPKPRFDELSRSQSAYDR